MSQRAGGAGPSRADARFPVRPRPAAGVLERMDEADADPAALDASLDHLDQVNRWLGGRRSVLRHLPALLPDGRAARILDAGTGSAWLPREIAAWAHARGRDVRIVAVEPHPATAAAAARRTDAAAPIRIVRADARALPHPAGAFDVALLSLTLHHFEEPDRVRVLRELARVARALVVSDLERCWPNYLGARLLAATMWRDNPITRHDGPVSVRRAFTRAELLDLARRAGLARARVHRHFFHRLTLVARATP